MADIPLSAVAARAQTFGIVEQVSDVIAAGVTGDILTIAAPDPLKQIVNLYLLVSQTANTQGGISITRDGNVLKSADLLGGNDAALVSNFRVDRSYAAASSTQNHVGIFKEIQGKSITVSKNAGNTTEAISYAYEILEPIE